MLQYIKDSKGEDALITPSGLQVMMEWEKPYMEACIDTIKPRGDVLEVGFGLAYSATAIQKYNPKSHTIIECDSIVLKKAAKWSKQYKNIHIVEGRWQDVLSQLGKFDTIFFDDYAPLTSSGVPIYLQKEHNLLEQALDKCCDIKFTDNDINIFLKEISQREDFALEELLTFLKRLISKDNISPKQKEYIIENFNNFKILRHDRLVYFLKAVLDKHMKKDASFSAYIDIEAFNTRENLFKLMLESLSDISYKIKEIDIKPSEVCSYYRSKKAVVLEIIKI